MRILGLALCFILASVAASDAAVDDPRVAELQATVAKLQGQMESLNGEVSKLKESEKQARSGLTASEAKVGQLQKESQTVKEELERVKAEGKAANDAARAKAAGTKELAAEKAKLEEEVKSLKDINSKLEGEVSSLKGQLDKLKGELGRAKNGESVKVSNLETELEAQREKLAVLEKRLEDKERELEQKYHPLVLAKDTSVGIGMLVRGATAYSTLGANWAKEGYRAVANEVQVGSAAVLEKAQPIVKDGVAKAQPLVKEGSARAKELWGKVRESVVTTAQPHVKAHVQPHYERHLKAHVDSLSEKAGQAWAETVKPALETGLERSKSGLQQLSTELSQRGGEAAVEANRLHGVVLQVLAEQRSKAIDLLNQQEAVAGEGDALLTAAIFLVAALLVLLLRWQLLGLTLFTIKLPFRILFLPFSLFSSKKPAAKPAASKGGASKPKSPPAGPVATTVPKAAEAAGAKSGGATAPGGKAGAAKPIVAASRAQKSV